MTTPTDARIAEALEEIGRQLKLANQLEMCRQQISSQNVIDFDLLDKGAEIAAARANTDRRTEVLPDIGMI